MLHVNLGNGNRNGEFLPLSAGQEAIWFMHQVAPDNGIYHLQLGWHVPQDIDVEQLKKCLQQLVDRHDAWRTTYHIKNNKPVRYVHQSAPLQFEEASYGCISDEQLKDYIKQDLIRPFELDKLPPTFWKLYRCDNTLVLVWFFSHICCDVNSMVNIAEELKVLYDGDQLTDGLASSSSLLTLDDHVQSQLSWIDSELGEQQKSFWLNELDDAKLQLNLPYIEPVNRIKQCHGESFVFDLSAEVTGAVAELTKHWDITPFGFYLLAFHLLIHRYTGENDVCIGTPTSGRSDAYREVVDYFVNVIATRTQLNMDERAELTVEDFFRENASKVQSWLANKDYPLPALLSELPLGKDTQQPQGFDCFFHWENINRFCRASDNPLVTCDKAGHENWHMGKWGLWRRLPLKLQFDDAALTLKLHKFSEKIYGTIEYNTRCFTQQAAAQFAEGYCTLLKNIVNNSRGSLKRLSIIPDSQWQKQVYQWNNSHCVYDNNLFLYKRFEATAAQKPHVEALRFNDVSLTYGQLNAQANRLANYLVGRGVANSSLVGIALPPSLDAYIAILAVFKAGGAYLPLDPEYPAERLEYMATDSSLALCITYSSCQTTFQTTFQTTLARYVDVIYLDAISDQLADQDEKNLELEIRPEHLAYVIYTSGSTGRPKGVMVSQGALANLTTTQQVAFQLSSGECILQFASLSFDASIFAVCLAWSHSSALVAVSKEQLMGLSLFETLKNHDISVVLLPPSLLAAYQPQELPKLHTLIVGGEACSQRLAEDWSQGRNMYNAYGPTEATVWATYACIDGSGTPPIGRPVANSQVYILDNDYNVVPVGVSGELYIGGDGLAAGYLNRPDLTAERFIKNPLPGTPGRYLYKTGDLARYRDDGQIDYLGRKDHQIKIRGYRIELGEIESACLDLPNVKEALALVQPLRNEPSLVLYVIPNDESSIDGSVDKQSIMSALRRTLPQYMLPNYIVTLPEFPLTHNQKIDRDALPSPLLECIASKNINTSGGLTDVLSGIWSDVLSVYDVPLDANFFDVGGHSLKLAEVYDRLPDNIREKISLLDLYQYPTINALVSHLADEDKTELLGEDQYHNHQHLALNNNDSYDIAIIGAALRAPNATSVENFWQSLCRGEEAITFFTDDQLKQAGVLEELINKPYYVKAKGTIDNISGFDAAFFDMSPREAQITDPQQRLFLECAWEALESTGYVGEISPGAVGVYAGVGANRYYTHHIASHPNLEESVGDYPIQLGNNPDFLATRVAYKLHLRGPALTIQTACSTSLVAIHNACRSLVDGECDMALAGGVSLGNLSATGYLHLDGMIHSPDGHTRSFDKDAAGTVVSQGVAVVLLRPLASAEQANDDIIAVIKGSSINNDGAEKPGFTAPSIEGQCQVIRGALKKAKINARAIGFVEAHGTGTKLGDPIEVSGLTQAYRADTKEKQYCALGSVKSNIGHLDSAAGAIGLIKAALVVKHGVIPPTLHYREPNPQLDIKNSPFFINTTATSFPAADSEKRSAGVSAFGLGGTNAHAIVQQYEKASSDNKDGVADSAVELEPSPQVREEQLILLSARNQRALLAYAKSLTAYLRNNEVSLKDLAYTLRKRRRSFQYRATLVVGSQQELCDQLENLSAHNLVDTEKSLAQCVFMFPGQGVNYRNMASVLCQYDRQFSEDLAYARNCLQTAFSRRGVAASEDDLNGRTERIHNIELGHPLLFIFEWALAKALLRGGIQPAAMIGHSAGEYVAATLAGVFSLEHAIDLMVVRGQLMHSLDEGGMLALQIDEEQAKQIVQRYPLLSIAAINAADQIVISGPIGAIDELVAELETEQAEYRRVRIKRAGHSSMLDVILDDFKRAVEGGSLQAPKIPFISNLTGDWITDEQAVSADYWVAHLRNPVMFGAGIETLIDGGYRHCIEVGPGRVLASLALCNSAHIHSSERDQGGNNQKPVQGRNFGVYSILNNYKENLELQAWFEGIGQLWRRGFPLTLDNLIFTQGINVTLPTYPFQRQEYWVEPKRSHLSFSLVTDNELPVTQSLDQTDDFTDDQVAVKMEQPLMGIIEIWCKALGFGQIQPYENYFELGGNSLIAVKTLAMLNERFGIVLPPQTFLECPTPAALSARIKTLITVDEDRDTGSNQHQIKHNGTSGEIKIKQSTNNMVRLKPGSPGVLPLVLVHPVGGEVYYYRDLAEQIAADRPVYAFQAPSIGGHGETYDNVPAMAEDYLSELKEQITQSGFILGGASFGGLVALEMAKQIESQQQRLTPLILIDTPVPGAVKANRMTNSVDVLNYLVVNSLSADIELDLVELRKLSLDEQIDHVAEVCKAHDIILPPHFTTVMVQTWMIHQKALFNYQMPVYAGSTLYLRHGESMMNFPSNVHKPWLDYLQGDVAIKQVPGNHITMNFGQNAVTLAAAIYPFLRDSKVVPITSTVEDSLPQTSVQPPYSKQSPYSKSMP